MQNNENEFDSNHIKAIIEEKIKRKITKAEIAEIGEIGQSNLNYWSSNEQNHFRFLVNISKHFKIPIDRLLKK